MPTDWWSGDEEKEKKMQSQALFETRLHARRAAPLLSRGHRSVENLLFVVAPFLSEVFVLCIDERNMQNRHSGCC